MFFVVVFCLFVFCLLVFYLAFFSGGGGGGGGGAWSALTQTRQNHSGIVIMKTVYFYL